MEWREIERRLTPLISSWDPAYREELRSNPSYQKTLESINEYFKSVSAKFPLLELDTLHQGIMAAIAQRVSNYLRLFITTVIECNGVGRQEWLSAKQDLATRVNQIVRNYGLTICHPDTNDPCILVVITDDYGGKYALQSRKLRTRSRTTRDLASLCPFKLDAMPKDLQVLPPEEIATPESHDDDDDDDDD